MYIFLEAYVLNCSQILKIFKWYLINKFLIYYPSIYLEYEELLIL